MKKDQIANTCFVAVLASMMFSGNVLADTVLLKNGNVIQGEVTEKNSNYLAILTPESNGVKTYYLSSRVDKVNGQNFSLFKVAQNKLSSKKFRPKRGQKNPIITLTLKDGKSVKGQLLDRNDQYFRLIPERSESVEEYLIENIVKAE